MRLSLSCALALPVLIGAAPACAQYRIGQPEVLAPPAQMPAPTARYAFAAAYARAGKPPIAVLWDRALTDTLSSNYDLVAQSSSASATEAGAGISRDGHHLHSSSSEIHSSVSRLGTREVAPARAERVLSEDEDWTLEAAFVSRLREAGARLVDRNVAMRTTAAAGTPASRSDRQTIETRALSGKAKLLLEVQQTLDPHTPFGVRFRIQIKDLSSGAILAMVAGDGSPPPRGPGRFVAGPQGFEREAVPGPTIEDAGTQLAEQTLSALASQWR